MPVTRRHVLALGGTALGSPALAQRGFPNKPIRVIVPWAPGGTTDVQMRVFCEVASRQLGQPLVVDNRPGVGGILGAQALLSERPDGYTVAQLPIAAFRTPYMMQRPPFDPMTDFTYVTHLTGYLLGVVVKADAPWRDFESFLAESKAHPGRFNYGSPGVGSTPHITMERIAQFRGIDWVQVPYRGVAENMQALLSGQVPVMADSSAWAPLVAEGQLRALVTWGSERAKRFQDVPTLRELGIDLVSASPYGLAGPKGMNPEVVRTLDAAFQAALADPAHTAILDRFDMTPMPMGPEAYTAFARRNAEEEAATVRRMGLRI